MRFIDVDSAWVDGVIRDGARIVMDEGSIAEVVPIAVPRNGLHALPGFVNAHSHLDLSFLRCDAMPRDHLAIWAKALVQERRQQSPENFEQAVRRGVESLLSTGTVAVGDINSTGRSFGVLLEGPLEGVVFHELVGSQTSEAWNELESTLRVRARLALRSCNLRVGISPHAPFSTPEDTFQRSFELAERLSLPAASHLAETREEWTYLCNGTGPFAELMQHFGMNPPHWSHRESGALERVLALACSRQFLARQFLAIHVNYPNDAELARLQESRTPVVFCPRSHQFFGHAPHAAPRMMARGIVVALGTDSTASNPGLDLWQEMAVARAAWEDVEDAQVFQAATGHGRLALGLPAARIVSGDPATFQLARSVERDVSGSEVIRAAVRGKLATVLTVIRGSVAWGDATLLRSA